MIDEERFLMRTGALCEGRRIRCMVIKASVVICIDSDAWFVETAIMDEVTICHPFLLSMR